MQEKRKFNRLYTKGAKKIFIRCEGGREEESLLIDIGANGMKISLDRPLDMGCKVQADLQILIKRDIYHVEGPVIRVVQKDKHWETVIRFDKIETLPQL